MAQKTLPPMDMPGAWQTMVALALNQPVTTDLSSCDWDSLRTFTVKNNLATLVHLGMQQHFPPEYRQQPKMIEIRLLSKMNRIQSQERVHALLQIAETFQQADIPMLSFKGPVLADELYGDPTLRNSCDLDILVAEETLPLACRCLQALGYEAQPSLWDKTPKRRALRQRRDQQMHRVFRKDGVMVELHWRIGYRFAVPFAALWDTRRSVSLMDQPIDTLNDSENLCYLITHGAGHGFRQLRWLLEIYTLLERTQFQLSELYAQMHRRGVGMLLIETLLLFYRLPGFAMPENLVIERNGQTLLRFRKDGARTAVSWQRDAAQDLHRALHLVRAVHPLLKRTNPEEGLDGKIYQRLLPTLGNRPPFLVSLLEPRAAELEWIDLPDRWFFLYYLLRPVHFLVRKRQKKSTPASH